MPAWVPTSFSWQLLLALFAVNCVGEIGVPIPLVLSAVLLFVGYLLAQGAIAEGASVLAVSVCGSVAGALLLYTLARWLGIGPLERALARVGAHRWWPKGFTPTAPPSVLTLAQSRLVPGLALPASIGAGLTRTPIADFVAGVVVSEAIFITPIVAIGFAFGATTGDFDGLAQRVPLIIGALAAAMLAIRLMWRLKRAAGAKPRMRQP